MEQNNVVVNGTAIFNLLATETRREMFKRLPINEIILGRLAARTGVDPVVMMNRLHNSYYASQAGVHGIQRVDDPIKYPSEFHYDIENMIEQNKKLVESEQKIIEQNKAIEQSDNDSIKNQLLERVRQRKAGNVVANVSKPKVKKKK